jgi:hypothetical protein
LLAVGSDGFVTLLRWSGTAWVPLSTVVSSNGVPGDRFGIDTTLSDDGRTLAVAAREEASAATGINGDQLDRSARGAGAVYIFELDGGDWRQTTYVRASNTAPFDAFGWALALSGDGQTLAVSARERHVSPAVYAGAVSVFRRTGATWAEDGYLVSTPSTWRFGDAVALSHDGTVLVVGSTGDGSDSSGINGVELGAWLPMAGAAHVFRRTAQGWTQEAFVKASQPVQYAIFGITVALSSDGNVVAIGAHNSSAAMLSIGSVTVARHTPAGWALEAEISPPIHRRDFFGWSVALSGDGAVLAVAALGHWPDYPGTAHLYDRLDAGWHLTSSLQSPNAHAGDGFGHSIACAPDAGLMGLATPEGTWTFSRP